MDISNSKLDV